MSSGSNTLPRLQDEHPFAEYVRILGKGKSGSRSLTAREAELAFTMVLAGEVEPLQLGAFLMLLRVKEESAEELAGFVRACRTRIGTVPRAQPSVLDWSSYAGKKNQQPWYLLSALLLAQNGVPVLMHGADGHTAGRCYSEQILRELGVPIAAHVEQALEHLQCSHFAYLPLRVLCPPLHDMMQYRHLLGLRSPVNTLARLINPARARYSIQSVFHPAYAGLHQQADFLLGQANALVFKGEGGEVEIKPQADTVCSLLRGRHRSELVLPRTRNDRPGAVRVLDSTRLLQCWLDGAVDGYGEQAIVATAAVALVLTELAADVPSAMALARQFWDERDRQAIQCH